VAENSQPDQIVAAAEAVNVAAAERRAFIRRAALVGLPLILATVKPRTVWARQSASCAASLRASKTCT
jgi:hypothetical protein